MSKSSNEHANSNNYSRRNGRPGKGSRKPWPKGCVWPEPVPMGEGIAWDVDLAEELDLDEEGNDLLEIKAYMDELVERGILHEDYSLNQDYDFEDDPDVLGYPIDEPDEFMPIIGEEYWLDGFELDMWEEDLSEHMNLLKIDISGFDTVSEITRVIGYEFINENLLRQAFTRRAFAAEYGLTGCSEELEFIGDSALNMSVTREIALHLAKVVPELTAAPFTSGYNEGDFSKIRSQFVCKEHLDECARKTGLDRFILYGSDEQPGESSREDMMEALIGAVAIDSGWSWDDIDNVIDRLIRVQLGNPDLLLKETFYELFNAWHQKHFGCMPEYEISGYGSYSCTMRFFIPENDKGVNTDQRVNVWAYTRSKARERAAEMAYRFVVDRGLWINLKDANVVPNRDESINQLQELYQKKYVEDRPEYRFRESYDGEWHCDCECGGVSGWGYGPSKTAAKKKAAYMVIIRLLDSAGLCKDEWKEEAELF